tara:strand:+ start:2399 stop:2698 length:300 start_codon:yes stop_codon:yes gene_type:complete
MIEPKNINNIGFVVLTIKDIFPNIAQNSNPIVYVAPIIINALANILQHSGHFSFFFFFIKTFCFFISVITSTGFILRIFPEIFSFFLYKFDIVLVDLYF